MKNHSSLLFLTSVDSKGKRKYKFDKALNTDDLLFLIKFMYSKKATKTNEIFTVDLKLCKRSVNIESSSIGRIEDAKISFRD